MTGTCAISKTQVVLKDTKAERAAYLQPDEYLQFPAGSQLQEH